MITDGQSGVGVIRVRQAYSVVVTLEPDPEYVVARGMARAVKEFSAARDEIEKELSQSRPNAVAPRKLLDTKSELSSAQSYLLISGFVAEITR